MNEYRELLIGCGHTRDKRVFIPGREYEWKNLTTLDIDPACEPDIVFDLSTLLENSLRSRNLVYDTSIDVAYYNANSTMESNTFDEIHAYEVLEHCGPQGNYKLFFAQFQEFWRVLKPDGYFCATVPDYRSIWAWGDPSHTRIINAGTLVFLSREQYEKQVGKTAMSDFRSLMGNMSFDIVQAQTIGETFRFVLRAIK